jgi:tripartite ATP-independent transporter DctM subunit
MLTFRRGALSMEWWLALLMMIGLLVVFMASGLPVAFAFFGVNVVGAVVFLGGEAGLQQLIRNAMASLTTFTLAPICLFILMGEIMFHTGLAFKAIDAIDRLVRSIPGRLSLVTLLGGTVFSSLSGSTIANTAMLGSVLLPEMLKRKYHPSMAMGPIMATGGIAMLIPPSALAVLLGSLGNISIATLLIAGIIPGLIMSLLYVGYVIVRCSINPLLAPAYELRRMSTWDRYRPLLVYVVPLSLIFVVVVGSIIFGLATPTESAALGCAATVLMVALYRELRLKDLWAALAETAKLSVMILFIIVASITFSQILAFSGATSGLLGMLRGLEMPPTVVLGIMLILLLFLGCFMDQVSMLMITIPFYIPLAQQLEISLPWLGVLILLCMEVSFTSPPFGLLLYVMKGVAPPNTTMKQIYMAALPFIMLDVFAIFLIISFPDLALWLPSVIPK